MPKANNQPQPRPWYKDINAWAKIITGLCVIAFITITIADNIAEKKAEANKPQPRSYLEVFTPEEAKKLGIDGHMDGPGDWKPDPDIARKAREFLENGGAADPALDAIQDGDYHDLLDQNGGPEGF